MKRLILPSGSSPRGAQMGRRNILPDDINKSIKLRIERLKWVDGDYDQFGAYWGNSGDYKVFKRFAPAIYWIHQCGKALLCEMVSIVQACSLHHTKIEMRFRRMLPKHGFDTWDLHLENLVKIRTKAGMRWSIVDYGCWIGG